MSSMITEDGYTTSGCPGPDGGGDGGDPGGGGNPGDGPTGPDPTDPDDPGIQADTCATDDPVINDNAVEKLFADLWANSNPHAAQSERVERAAWIVQTPNGLVTVPWTDADFGPCYVSPHYGSFEIPTDAIAWVHTHPFTPGELQTACPPTGYDQNGAPIYATYNSWPNANDVALSHAINNSLQRKIDTYTIDASKIMRYVAADALTAIGVTPFGRCGY